MLNRKWSPAIECLSAAAPEAHNGAGIRLLRCNVTWKLNSPVFSHAARAARRLPARTGRARHPRDEATAVTPELFAEREDAFATTTSASPFRAATPLRPAPDVNGSSSRSARNAGFNARGILRARGVKLFQRLRDANCLEGQGPPMASMR